MAEIANDGGGNSGGKKRAKKGSARIDMTPMVDLGFLLLTFFVLTSTFSKPKVMSLIYPAKDKDKTLEQPKVDGKTMTFLVTLDKVYYYEGEFFEKGSAKGVPSTLTEVTFSNNGVRKLLAEKNEFVIREKIKLDGELNRKVIVDSVHRKRLVEAQSKDKALKVLVKTDTKALCKNFIDLVDELVIANIGMIAPAELMKGEQLLIDEKTPK